MLVYVYLFAFALGGLLLLLVIDHVGEIKGRCGAQMSGRRHNRRRDRGLDGRDHVRAQLVG